MEINIAKEYKEYRRITATMEPDTWEQIENRDGTVLLRNVKEFECDRWEDDE